MDVANDYNIVSNIQFVVDEITRRPQAHQFHSSGAYIDTVSRNVRNVCLYGHLFRSLQHNPKGLLIGRSAFDRKCSRPKVGTSKTQRRVGLARFPGERSSKKNFLVLRQ